MKFSVSKGIAAVQAVTAGLVACLLASTAPAFSAPAVTAPVAFPQDFSDLKADPEARYGRLPNGFTYIIRKNETPAKTAAVFLRIRAGSLMETERQKGLAHFIEHMAFNGTAHIPEGELKKMLERHGFAFGADANAYTSESKTVYTLFAPKSDGETLDTALFILREVAGNMTLNTSAIDRERGVILAEERVRDTPATHAAVAINKWMFAGQKYADYALPIGSVDVIKTATRADMAAFYNAWYRPELATLVVVGDFDPDQMEAKIKATFGNWKGNGPMPAEPNWGQYKPQGLRAFTYKEKDLRETLTFNWVVPPETRHDSLDRRAGSLLDGAGLSALNRRFEKRMAEPGTAFLGAFVARNSAYKTGRVLTLYVVPQPGFARPAFEQAYDILHTFLVNGITPQEVGDLVNVLDTTVKTQVTDDKTRSNSALAADMLGQLDTDAVFLSSTDGIALLNAARPGLTVANLNARMKDLFNGDGPLLTHAGDSLGDLDESELKAEYAALNKLGVATYTERARKPWPYTDFGTPAAPISHATDKDFGYGHYVYPNGVVLNVKPTKLASNQVFIEVDFLGGLLRFDPKANRPYPLADGSIFVSGGLGKMTETQYTDTLYGKRYAVRYVLRDASAVLAGITTPGDLSTQLQLLTAYATDPGFRRDGFNSVLTSDEVNLKALRSVPAGVLAYNFDNIVRSADPRYDATILERVKMVRFEEIQSILSESIKDSPIIISVVGDVDEAQVVTEIGKTFGALPPRPAKAPRFPGADQMAFPPKQHEFTLYHEGRNDQSVSVALWPTNGYYADTRESRGLSVLTDILKNRLMEDLREKQGADYSPTANSVQDDDYANFGYIQARASIKAGGDTGFRAALDRIVTDLQTKPVSADELLRVKTPIYESIDNNLKSNVYWITTLPALEMYGDKARAAELSRRAEYEAVTPEQIMLLARKYLNNKAALHIQVIPSIKTPAAVTPAAKPAPKAALPKSAPPPIPVVPPAAKPVAKPAVKPTAMVTPAPASPMMAKPVALAPAAPKPAAAVKSAAPVAAPQTTAAPKPVAVKVTAPATSPAPAVTASPTPKPIAVKPVPAAPTTPKPLSTKPVTPVPTAPMTP